MSVEPAALSRADIVYLGSRGAGRKSNLKYLHHALLPTLAAPPENGLQLQARDEFGVFELLRLSWNLRGVRALEVNPLAPSQVDQLSLLGGINTRCDGVVLVIGAGQAALGEAVEVFAKVSSKLAGLPVVVQLNQRDRDDAVPVARVRSALGANALVCVEAIAPLGTGVAVTAQEAVKAVLATKRAALVKS